MRDLLPILFLGLIQGITEFLPISSDGHLALASLLFDVQDGGLALTVLLHAGTFLATLLVLRERAFPALKDGLRALVQPRLFEATPGGQDAKFVLLASVPTALIGLGLKHTVEEVTSSPLWIGLGFLVTGAVLISTRFFAEGKVEHPAWRAALIVGLLQGLAVLPGVSRSGLTIAALLFLKVERSRAFELSMLLSLPAVLGALILELPEGIRQLHELGPALLGVLVAFVSGIFALVWLRRIVSSGMFPWFAFWVVPLGFATLAMAVAWPH
jgi:undecaprenyl-diphosphatase